MHRSYSSLITALILAAVLSLAFVGKRFSENSSFIFEVTVQSSTRGVLQIFYDIGYGFRESDSVRVDITKVNVPVIYRLRLPQGNYRALRFDPIDRESTIIISDPTILGPKILTSGDFVVKHLPTSEFRAVQQISSFEVEGNTAKISTAANANDPILELSFDRPVSLKLNKLKAAAKLGLMFLITLLPGWVVIWLGITFYIRQRGRIISVGRGLSDWSSRHPSGAVVITAITSVVLACYPVIFFGKSFVSPNYGAHLLYEAVPTLPGYEDTQIESAMGSDVGAMMWQHFPYSVIQSRALFQDFELPLWNRYNSSGLTLYGQGQSMLGDPIHLTVLLAKGASWAWDLKFVLARMLFSAGLGLSVYTATRHLPASLIMSFSSTFVGVFSFYINHPVYFSVCYSPWILYCWFRMVQARTEKQTLLWIAGWTLSNWTVINSGTVKEAYMLFASLNLCGVLLFLLSKEEKGVKIKKGFKIVWASVLFMLISAPAWMTFLDTLGKTFTGYQSPSAVQIQPNLMIGLYDDVFYRQLVPDQNLLAPSGNFFILLWFLWSLASLKKLISDRVFVAVCLSIVVPFALVFGVIPISVIIKIPFLGNVFHIDSTFSIVMIIHLVILAGFGLKVFWEQRYQKDWKVEWLVTGLLLAALLSIYFGSTQSANKSTFFYRYGPLLVLAFLSLPYLTRRVLLDKERTNSKGLFFLLMVCFILLHGRYGMHLSTGMKKIDNFVVNPPVRANLQPPSPAIAFVKSRLVQPFRVVGFGSNLFAGYNAALGLESINGPDALMNRHYRELTKLFPVDWGWDWRIITHEASVSDLKSVYDFLNIKYYLSSPKGETSKLPGLELVGRFDLDIYQSDSVWPRGYFTNILTSYEAPAEFVDMIRKGDGRPFAAIQQNELVKNPDLKEFLGDRQQGQVVSATDYKLTNNTTSFTIIAPTKGIVVLTEAYLDQDFQVTLNGKPARYFRVNHAFKGVLVEAPGIYQISYSYWPRNFTVSLWMSAGGVMLFFIWMVWPKRPIKEEKEPALLNTSKITKQSKAYCETPL